MFGFFRKKLVQWFLPEVEDLLAMALNEINRLWNSSQDALVEAIGRAIAKTPLKDTATQKELHETIDAFEDWIEASGDTKEFKKFKKCFLELFKK